MARELWLMRHAKAKRYEGMEDYDRPLKKKGRYAANLIGDWLNKQGWYPDLIVSSPALRAIATANIVCNALNLDLEQIRQDKRLYDEGMVRMNAVLAECPAEAGRVLIVGHNPELENLLTHLAMPDSLPLADKLMPTAALIRLSLPDDWRNLAKGCAKVLSVVYPKMLAESIEEDSED